MSAELGGIASAVRQLLAEPDVRVRPRGLRRGGRPAGRTTRVRRPDGDRVIHREWIDNFGEGNRPERDLADEVVVVRQRKGVKTVTRLVKTLRAHSWQKRVRTARGTTTTRVTLEAFEEAGGSRGLGTFGLVTILRETRSGGRRQHHVQHHRLLPGGGLEPIGDRAWVRDLRRDADQRSTGERSSHRTETAGGSALIRRWVPMRHLVRQMRAAAHEPRAATARAPAGRVPRPKRPATAARRRAGR